MFTDGVLSQDLTLGTAIFGLAICTFSACFISGWSVDNLDPGGGLWCHIWGFDSDSPLPHIVFLAFIIAAMTLLGKRIAKFVSGITSDFCHKNGVLIDFLWENPSLVSDAASLVIRSVPYDAVMTLMFFMLCTSDCVFGFECITTFFIRTMPMWTILPTMLYACYWLTRLFLLLARLIVDHGACYYGSRLMVLISIVWVFHFPGHFWVLIISGIKLLILAWYVDFNIHAAPNGKHIDNIILYQRARHFFKKGLKTSCVNECKTYNDAAGRILDSIIDELSNEDDPSPLFYDCAILRHIITFGGSSYLDSAYKQPLCSAYGTDFEKSCRKQGHVFQSGSVSGTSVLQTITRLLGIDMDENSAMWLALLEDAVILISTILSTDKIHIRAGAVASFVKLCRLRSHAHFRGKFKDYSSASIIQFLLKGCRRIPYGLHPTDIIASHSDFGLGEALDTFVSSFPTNRGTYCDVFKHTSPYAYDDEDDEAGAPCSAPASDEIEAGEFQASFSENVKIITGALTGNSSRSVLTFIVGLLGVVSFFSGGIQSFSDVYTMQKEYHDKLSQMSTCGGFLKEFFLGYDVIKECIKKQNLDPLFVNSQKAQKWIHNANTWISFMQSELDFNEMAPDWHTSFGIALKEFTPIYESLKGDKVWGPLLASTRTRLLNTYVEEFTPKLRTCSRMAPMGVLLHGSSSIGKTSICNYLVRAVATAFDINEPHTYTYTGGKYWDGYPKSTFAVILDDIAAKHPNSPGEDLVTAAAIHLINNAAFILPMAEIQDKKTVVCAPNLVIGTTNNLRLNAYSTHAEPSALIRRFDTVIEAKVKGQYCYPGSTMLDPSAARNWQTANPQCRLDMWDFNVTRPIVNAGQITYQQIANFSGPGAILELCRYMHNAGKVHRTTQIQIANSLNKPLLNCMRCGLNASELGLAYARSPCVTCVYPQPQNDPVADNLNSKLLSGTGINIDDTRIPREAMPFQSSFSVHVTTVGVFCTTVAMYTGALANAFLVCIIWASVWIIGNFLYALAHLGWVQVTNWVVLRLRDMGELVRALITAHMVEMADDVIERTVQRHFSDEAFLRYGFEMYTRQAIRVRGFLDRTYSENKSKIHLAVVVVAAAFIIYVGYTAGQRVSKREIPHELQSLSQLLGLFSRKEDTTATPVVTEKAPTDSDPECAAKPSRKRFNLPTDTEAGLSHNVYQLNHAPAPSSISVRVQNACGNSQFNTVIRKAIVTMRVSCGNGSQAVHAIHLRDGIFMTVRHPFKRGAGSYNVECIAPDNEDTVGKNSRFILLESAIVEPQSELVFFQCPATIVGMKQALPASHSGASHFAEEFYSSISSTTLLKMGLDKYNNCLRKVTEHHGLWRGQLTNYPFDSDMLKTYGLAKPYHSVPITLQEGTRAGFCGAPWMCTTNNGAPFIVGIHCGYQSDANVAYPIAVRHRDVLEGIDRVKRLGLSHGGLQTANSFDFLSDGPPHLEGATIKSGVHERCPWNYLHLHLKECGVNKSLEESQAESRIMPMGNFPGHRSEFKSAVCSTPFRQVAEEHGHNCDLRRPIPNKSATRHRVMTTLSTRAQGFPKHWLQKIGAFIAKKIHDGIKELKPDARTGPLSDHEAVNGLSNLGHSRLKSINLKTSTGFPWNTAKNKWCIDGKRVFDRDMYETITVDESFLNLVASAEEKAVNNGRSGQLCKAFYKDEPLKPEKAEIAKVRMIYASSVVENHMLRKQFGSLICLLQSYPGVYKNYPGTNAEGEDWTTLANRLIRVGKYGYIDGDFKGYDTEVFNRDMISSVASVLLSLNESFAMSDGTSSFTERDLKIQKAVIANMSQPYVDFFGDLIAIDGINPSGTGMTVHVNGIGSRMLIELSLVLLAHEKGHLPHIESLSYPQYVRFIDNFEMAVYGDDSVVAMGLEGYGFDGIQKVMGAFGIQFTPGNKNEPTYHTKPLDRIDFLKRKFVFDSKLGRYRAPLRLAVLDKMLCVWIKSENTTEIEQSRDVLAACHRNAAMHEEDVFNLYHKVVLACADSMGLDADLLRLQTYDEYARGFYGLDTQVHELQMSEITDNTTPSLGDPGPGASETTRITHMNTVAEATMPPASQVATSYLSTSEADLAGYLSRPVPLIDFAWAEGTYLQQHFDPWARMLRHPSIVKKLYGYSRFRANLKIKVLINGSPFQYAPLMVSYKPLSYAPHEPITTFDEHNDYAGGNIDNRFSNKTPLMMGRSTRPHIILNPSGNTEGELSIPFVYYMPWFDLATFYKNGTPKVGDYMGTTQLGALNMLSASVLRTVSASAGSDVSINVISWFEDVQLAGPTGVFQSEFESRPISTVASAIAGVSRLLSYVPQIAPMSRATEMVSSTVGALAARMGWSVVPNLREADPMCLNYGSGMCTTDTGYPLDTMAIDSRNELSIDPSIASGSDDQMAFRHILSKNTIIGFFTWSSIESSGTPTGYMVVSPVQYFSEVLSVGSIVTDDVALTQMTPSAHVAQCFDFWTGPITFTFTVFATKFHRGRLRITYDPEPIVTVLSGEDHLTIASDPVNQINEIMDISTNPVMSMTIPFMRQTGWARVDHSPTTMGARDRRTVNNTEVNVQGVDYNSCMNGVIRFEVLNELNQPTTTSDVTVMVQMDCKDVRFALPRELPSKKMEFSNVHTFQSADGGLPGSYNNPGDGSQMPNDAGLYMGEVVPSVRNLIQRSGLLHKHRWGACSAGDFLYNCIGRIPGARGYTRNGASHYSVAEFASISYFYNPFSTHFFHWFAAAYVGLRGSTIFRHYAERTYYPFLERTYEAGPWTELTEVRLSSDMDSVVDMGSQQDGVTMNMVETTNVVRMPQYSRFTFLPGNVGRYPDAVFSGTYYSSNEALTEEGYLKFGVMPSASTNSSQLNARASSILYFSAGHDMSLLMYMNPPTVLTMDSAVLLT